MADYVNADDCPHAWMAHCYSHTCRWDQCPACGSFRDSDTLHISHPVRAGEKDKPK